MNNSVTEQEIIDSFPDSLFAINPKGKIIYAKIKNEEKILLTNNETVSIIGKTITASFIKDFSKKVKENIKNDQNSSFEIEICKKTFSSWFEIRLKKIKENAVLIIIKNITGIKKSLIEKQKFYHIAEQSHEMIMITDVTGNIEYINPMVSLITGYSANELIGKKTSVLKSGKQKEAFYNELWDKILTGESFKAKFHNLKKNGEYYVEEKIISPFFNSKGEITNFISTGRDITQEHKTELKTIKYKKLEITKLEKGQKNRTLSLIQKNESERIKFAKEIHEGLNQMLSVAMSNIESLSHNKIISIEEKAKIEFINQMVSEIIQELRGISTNLSPISLYEFGLFSVTQQLVKKINFSYKDIHIKFVTNIAGIRFKNEIEINFYRIIQEAIQNTIKHSFAKKILLQIDYNNGNLTLLIKDDGKGINMNLLEFKKMNTFGILNIEARAKSIGALLKIKTKNENGFEINISVNTKKIDA